MLSPLRELLQNYELILASSSVQRQNIFKQIGFKFTSIPSPFDEDSLKVGNFAGSQAFVETLAHHKAAAVADICRLKSVAAESQPKVIVGADTVIVDGAKIIGKPHTKETAIATLSSLSGRTHSVCTGVSIIVCNQEGTQLSQDTFTTVTEVEFGDLSREIISSYVDTLEPLNKAGAYGIQGIGAMLVKSIKGDYYNVVGFPIHDFCNRLVKLLQKMKK